MSTPSNPFASVARQPEDLHLALADAFNRRDVDALLALYAEDATLVPTPGAAVTGTAALRKALSGFLSLSPRETFVRTVSVVRAGDLALTQSHWGMQGTQPDGANVVLDHHGVEVMRRQEDGTWRFQIDDPFAGDAAAARGVNPMQRK